MRCHINTRRKLTGTLKAGWWAVLFLAATSADAVPIISADPSPPTAETGTQVVVDLSVSNLQGVRVGAYDIRISWNADVLTLAGVSFDVGLDGPAASFQFFDSSTPGSLVLSEFSLGDLSNQADTVRLATLGFTADASGESTFQITGNISPSAFFLGDFSGQPLNVNVLPTSVTVNGTPVANAQSVTIDEDAPVPITITGTDPDNDPLTFSVTQSPAHGTLSGTAPNLTFTPASDFNGEDSFLFTASDAALTSEPAEVSITIDPVNDLPLISVDLTSQTVQYSDGISTVTLTATDIDSTLTGTSLSSTNVPAGLTTSAGTCSPLTMVPAGIGSECTWSLSGDILAAAGSYTPDFSVSDSVLTASANTTIEVLHEEAAAQFSGSNPLAIGVDSPGSDSSLAFALNAVISELEPDEAMSDSPASGDISLAGATMQLVPVGPGSPVAPQSCTIDVTGSGYDAEMTVTCAFDDAPVNTYSVELNITGDYYAGSDEDVLTVFDPSLGFTTGGGWFYWPATALGAYPGDRTNFGYTMKYNKKGLKVRGSLLLIRRTADRSKFRIKSNALDGLALGEDVSVPFGWASFSGKTTYLEPGWEESIGNHEFTTYVEDHDDSGAGTDRIWIEVRDRQDVIIPHSSMAKPATDNTAPLQGGNIVAPHSGGGS